MAKDTQWKPVLNGKTYCSPACGGGCLRAAFDLAQSRAKRLAERLGKGWKPVVWENLGWHFKAVSASGFLKVHPSGGKGWMAFLGFGDSGGRWVANASTPEAAIKKVRAAARAEVGELRRLLEES